MPLRSVMFTTLALAVHAGAASAQSGYYDEWASTYGGASDQSV